MSGHDNPRYARNMPHQNRCCSQSCFPPAHRGQRRKSLPGRCQAMICTSNTLAIIPIANSAVKPAPSRSSSTLELPNARMAGWPMNPDSRPAARTGLTPNSRATTGHDDGRDRHQDDAGDDDAQPQDAECLRREGLSRREPGRGKEEQQTELSDGQVRRVRQSPDDRAGAFQPAQHHPDDQRPGSGAEAQLDAAGQRNGDQADRQAQRQTDGQAERIDLADLALRVAEVVPDVGQLLRGTTTRSRSPSSTTRSSLASNSVSPRRTLVMIPSYRCGMSRLPMVRPAINGLEIRMRR